MTCLASRAVHIECTCSMDNYSFIQVLRQFMARRGNIRILHYDNGLNFVGTQRELAKVFQEMYHQNIQHFLENLGSGYIIWHGNPSCSKSYGESLGEANSLSTEHSVVIIGDTWKELK